MNDKKLGVILTIFAILAAAAGFAGEMEQEDCKVGNRVPCGGNVD